MKIMITLIALLLAGCADLKNIKFELPDTKPTVEKPSPDPIPPVIIPTAPTNTTPAVTNTTPVLTDGYKPTSGLPRAKITCRVWDLSNSGQSTLTWKDNRDWKPRTASNGKVLDAIIFVFIVRDGQQIAARRLDHVHYKRCSVGTGNMFFDPADSYHEGNPFCDVDVRPRKGDKWAMCLTSQSGSERSTVSELATWK